MKASTMKASRALLAGRAATARGPRTLAFASSALQVRCASGAASPSDLKKTPLYDLHVAKGGKMVPFADHSLPVQYSSLSLAESHHFTRKHASLFDVSHMVQHIFKGKDAAAFLETITPSDWKDQGAMQGK